MFKQFKLIKALVFSFLILDGGLNRFFILADRRNVVISGLKIFPDKILPPSLKIAGYLDGTLAFYKSYYLRHRIFWRNRKHDVNMVRFEMPFYHRVFFCFANSRNIAPKYFRKSAKIAFFRYFGIQMTWCCPQMHTLGVRGSPLN